MKTVAKIDPEKEYEIAKKIIELASEAILKKEDLSSLGNSVDNLISAARILLERETIRRGHPKPPPQVKPKKIKVEKVARMSASFPLSDFQT